MSVRELLKTPLVRHITLELKPPSLSDNRGDIDRLRDSLYPIFNHQVAIPLELFNKISETLKLNRYRIEIALLWDMERWNLIEVYPPKNISNLYGIAIDLGTTRVHLSIIDLKTSKEITTASFLNPQYKLGKDILTRINIAAKREGLKELQDLIVSSIKEEVVKLAIKAKISIDNILIGSIAGNTTMTHLLLGLNPQSICREPYVPIANSFGFLEGNLLHLPIHPRGKVYLFPNVGSYFGGDLISGILASGLSRSEEVNFLVDVGTNAEVVLSGPGWMLCCAGAAGPALEGDVVKMGMLAEEGAIEHVKFDPETLEPILEIIGNCRPRGICGSGLIDLVAELFRYGLIDMSGRFITNIGNKRIQKRDGVPSYIIAFSEETEDGREISFSQIDMDILLRSKAAMFTILYTIIKEVGISFKDIQNFFVAGAFGTYIDPAQAIFIGMLPDIPIEKYVPLGNSSLKGCLQLLTREGAVSEVDDICKKLTYMELNVNQAFMNRFSAARFIPHTDIDMFPSVKEFLIKNGRL